MNAPKALGQAVFIVNKSKLIYDKAMEWFSIMTVTVIQVNIAKFSLHALFFQSDKRSIHNNKKQHVNYQI